MDQQKASSQKIDRLMEKGVHIPAPETVFVGMDVGISKISGNGSVIYPGCRIHGSETVISENARIGYEAPVTLEDCWIGPSVELKGGFFKKSLFLEKSSMGSCAHVREGCLLEEQASGAHCVGIKQTILFPFVTLGSLINFCDCLMAGGTSSKNHSEVGSSYIHFNFTPEGDKTTASLLGDVPRGVMLNQPPIFLGGQGGMIGPLRMGFGNVVAAGAILRKDFLKDSRLIVPKPHRGLETDFVPGQYQGSSRIIRNNVIYIANLVALESWYREIRRPFFMTQEMGGLMFKGAKKIFKMVKKERIKRFELMVSKMPFPDKEDASRGSRLFMELHENLEQLREHFEQYPAEEIKIPERNRFIKAFEASTKGKTDNYIDAVQSLSKDAVASGTQWLDGIIEDFCKQAQKALPSLTY